MDNLTKAQRRKNMQNIRSAGTSPERAVMCELRRLNIYFAKNVRSITGKPDIVFRRKKTIVFIDSDFWHGHPSRYIKPKSNVSYWQGKVKSNKQRDEEVTRVLRKEGWKVLRLWESDINRNLTKCVNRITRYL
jgi:DNA mismatch endonuclease (patch repair protein)